MASAGNGGLTSAGLATDEDDHRWDGSACNLLIAELRRSSERIICRMTPAARLASTYVSLARKNYLPDRPYPARFS